ncbi:zinc dependent phospholipase C family protein [Salidesulfovibrio onnuriiensis]|uniref:zinc dependent phospholipase C family protein n=1 Tax=Salidesulfovibrio onnuriiensis TaxID=2583823 RepID=UPI0011C9D3D4|nr:zinc dependent phospholipase C family protein [Salidesulfovibrio onnuriiensis]
MKHLMIFCATVATVLLALPSDALAWGPGAHLAIGQAALDNLCLLPPLIARLLARHNDSFLYGCLCADIFIGKGTRFKPGHSHNWTTGFKLLKSARESGTLAYAYGYLTHLAADVVAHNYFVPNMLWSMPCGGKTSHVYVEMHTDMTIDWSPELALRLFRAPNRSSEGVLLSATEQRRWSFLIKKRLMMGSLNLASRKSWDSSLDLAERMLPWPHNTGYRQEMLDLATRTVLHFLEDPTASPALAFDPIGSRNLDRVRGLRTKKLRRGADTPLLFETPGDLADLPALPQQPASLCRAQGQ